MKIINNSDLTYEDLGYFIDRLRDKEETLYIYRSKKEISFWNKRYEIYNQN